MPPWYRDDKLRIAAMALAAGLLLGAVVTFAAGIGKGEPDSPGTPARSMAAALASDQVKPPPAPAKAVAKPAKAKPVTSEARQSEAFTVVSGRARVFGRPLERFRSPSCS
ncbi:MAG: hypothetical protein ACXW08_12225 [Solirubrobacteraceae bacterium]